MDPAQLLSRYADAWEMTRQMLEAARSEDWDTLLMLSDGRDQIFSPLMQAPPAAPANLQLANEIATLIQRILAADQQIQDLSRAWMKEISGLLASVHVEKKLLKAYEPV